MNFAFPRSLLSAQSQVTDEKNEKEKKWQENERQVSAQESGNAAIDDGFLHLIVTTRIGPFKVPYDD